MVCQLSVELAARARGLALAYNGKLVVEASDFGIPAAALTAVIGPNGAGKSTLLHALTGLVKPVTGELKVFGESPDKVRGKVGYVLQATKVNEVMPVTVREAVAMGRYAVLGSFRWFGKRDQQLVDQAIERLDIGELSGAHLTELSGGQRQRVFVAQGLAQDAELLLLDEPATGLDLVSRDLIAAALDDELARGRTVVITTHDLADASGASHVLLMAQKVFAEGAPDEVLAPDVLSGAYGIGILHLEDGTIVLDDAAHGEDKRHVHFERG